MTDKTYCVVATNRITKKREMITGEIEDLEVAHFRKNRINESRQWRKTHKYFHVARFPYKSK